MHVYSTYWGAVFGRGILYDCVLTIPGVDENVVNIVEGVADAVENQADASRDATLADRLKMAGNSLSYMYVASYSLACMTWYVSSSCLTYYLGSSIIKFCCLHHTAGDTAGMVGDNVDNAYVSVGHTN